MHVESTHCDGFVCGSTHPVYNVASPPGIARTCRYGLVTGRASELLFSVLPFTMVIG